jgi:hypothetical protein
MEVESSLVTTQQPRKHGRNSGPDYVPGALFFGVPALVVLLIVWAVNAAAGPTISKIPFLAPAWSVVSFFLFILCGCILVPCLAIIGWRVFKVWKQHERETAREQKNAAIQNEEYKLAHERARAARLANSAVERAELAGDNYTITAGRDSVSIQIVRAATQLEQTRIQYAGRVQQQLEKAQQKQIAGPVDPDTEPRLSAGPARSLRGAPTANTPKVPDELAEKLAQIPAPSKPGEIQAFAELLDEGIIQAALSVGLICLGYVSGALRFGTWLDLYSCGVGGVSGSGKTTTVRFLLFQAILAGAKLLMVDPAIHEPEESLAAQFSMLRNIHLMKPCDDNPDAVAKRIRWFMHEYVRRKAKGIKGPAYIFVLDEFNEIIALLPAEIRKELAELMLRIAQSGRKFGLFVMVIGQRWSEQDLGGKPHGAAIRTSLAATLAHRFTDESQAQKLAGGRYAAECLNLDQGHYYFRDTHGVMSYTVTPDTVAADGVEIQRLLDILADESTVESTLETFENGALSLTSKDTGPLSNRATQGENAGAEPENAHLHTLARSVLRLQAENMQKPDIMRQVWGVNPGATEAYKQALKEYQQVMQFIAEQLGV